MPRFFVLLFLMLCAPAGFAAHIPASSMDSLAGETVDIPQIFEGKKTLVILAFAHDQRKEAHRVMMLVADAQKANASLHWLELPIIDAPAIAHGFIRNGMRDGSDASMHAQIIPQFVDAEEWHTNSGIADKTPLLAWVDGQGTVQKTIALEKIKTTADLLRFIKSAK